MLNNPQLDSDAPWKDRFRIPRTSCIMIAENNPDRGLAISNRSGTYQLYAWDVPTGEFTQLTDRPHGQFYGYLSPDGKYVYYHHDEMGNELGHLKRLPYGGGDAVDITPELPPYSLAGLHISTNGQAIGFTRADREGFFLYTARLDSDHGMGTFQLISHQTNLLAGPVFSADGSLALTIASERPKNLKYHLLVFDVSSGALVARLSDEPDGALRPGMFSPIPGDFRLIASTNLSGYPRPFIWDPIKEERRELELQDLEGTVSVNDWSRDGRYLLLNHVSRAVKRLYLYDLDKDRLINLEHPAGNPFGTYFGPGKEIFVHWQDSTHPTRLIALDMETGTVNRTVLETSAVPPCRPWKSIIFTSSDGQEIQAWLAIPDGPGPYPTILNTHGGPESAKLETFSPESQAWLDHGFAYLTINYRGSTTFGRKFKEKIWGDLGHWEVEDMAAAYGMLVDRGISRPDAVFLTGWSYGGYLTLQAMGVRPDLWAGGMAGIAISDWRINHEDSNEALRNFDEGLFGGTPEEIPEKFAKSSPVTYVDRMKAPVLVVQGRNDTRCPGRQIEEYQEKMEALGNPIEVIWFDTGHAGPFANLEQNIKHHENLINFAYRVLNGEFSAKSIDAA